MKKLVVNSQYLILIGLIVAQCVIGGNWYVGQYIYLGCNLIAALRCFILRRPTADKVKDCACFGITLGLIGFRMLGF